MLAEWIQQLLSVVTCR